MQPVVSQINGVVEFCHANQCGCVDPSIKRCERDTVLEYGERVCTYEDIVFFTEDGLAKNVVTSFYLNKDMFTKTRTYEGFHEVTSGITYERALALVRNDMQSYVEDSYENSCREKARNFIEKKKNGIINQANLERDEILKKAHDKAAKVTSDARIIFDRATHTLRKAKQKSQEASNYYRVTREECENMIEDAKTEAEQIKVKSHLEDLEKGQRIIDCRCKMIKKAGEDAEKIIEDAKSEAEKIVYGVNVESRGRVVYTTTKGCRVVVNVYKDGRLSFEELG